MQSFDSSPMAASTTLVSMAHGRKVDNLRAYMVNLANSRGFSLPETNLFEQKFLDLCLSPTPDHPTYSAMIYMAIMELNKEDGACEEAISDFIKSKYKNLPFAHTSLLSHHLAKLVEKREIFCDCNNYCYSLSGEKNTVSSTDTKTGAVKKTDQRVVDEVMTRQNAEETGSLLEEQSLIEYRTSPKRKACCDINAIEVMHTEDNGVEAGLRDSTIDTLRIEGVAEEPGVVLENSETEGRIEANNEVVVLDEQNDVLMEAWEKEVMENISKQRGAKLRRTSNTMKESCVEVKREAYKRLLECQNEVCNNIIALEKMLKQCRVKDRRNKAVSEIDGVSRLSLSMESCKELRKVAQKIQSQLSEIIDSCDGVVPYSESRGCEIKDITKEFCKEGPKMITPCGDNGFEETSKQLEQKEREIGSQKKTRIKRPRDKVTTAVRKSPRFRLCNS